MNAKIDHFSELSKYLSDKSSVCNDFLTLMAEFKLGHALSALNMEKQKGTKSIELLKYLLIFRLFGKSVHQSLKHQFASFIEGGHNQFYRFLNRPNMDWRRLLYRVNKSFFSILKEKSADLSQIERYFILDDTTLAKSGIRLEGISRVFDHVTQTTVLGYKLLLLAITDKKSTLPLDFTMHAEAGKKHNFGLKKKELINRFRKIRKAGDCLRKRVEELELDKPTAALEMLRRAVKNGYICKYLLMDKCFFSSDFIKKVREIKDGAIHIVTLLNKKGTIFNVDGKKYSAKVLIDMYKRKGFTSCREYKSYYARVKADYKGTPVQLFLIRYGKSSKYEVMITTDMKLNFKSTFELYQIRWNIEVLFFEMKQHLALGKCQSVDMNAQIADSTLAFIGYTVIALRKRFSDYETFGELFRDIQEGWLELTFIERLLPIIVKLLERFSRLFDITLNDMLEKALSDKKDKDGLNYLLRDIQDFKERA